MKTQSVLDSEKDQTQAMEEIWRALKKLRYGAVEIIVHDSKIVQIECKEKIRFEQKK